MINFLARLSDCLYKFITFNQSMQTTLIYVIISCNLLQNVLIDYLFLEC
jgi:hypothetical protein